MNLNALRAVAHTIKPIKGYDESQLHDEKILLEATNIAKKNKVLLAFYEGLVKRGVDIPENLRLLAIKDDLRRKLYLKALAEISEIAEREGIEFMVFKSIKPFPYVGDDLDIFTPTRDMFTKLINVLRGRGYHLMGYGPPEATLIRRVRGMNLYIDLHKAFSASYIPYVDGLNIWKRRIKRKFNGLNLIVPSLEDEILILIGHSLLKEFRLNLAEFYHTLLLQPELNQDRLSELMLNEKMESAVNIFLYALSQVHKMLYSEEIISTITFSNNILLKVTQKVISESIENGIKMPYRFPLCAPATAYFDKLRAGLLDGGNRSLNLLLCYLKAPFTNREGIKVLWNYISK
jgi:hypothetical protein